MTCEQDIIEMSWRKTFLDENQIPHWYSVGTMKNVRIARNQVDNSVSKWLFLCCSERSWRKGRDVVLILSTHVAL